MICPHCGKSSFDPPSDSAVKEYDRELNAAQKQPRKHGWHLNDLFWFKQIDSRVYRCRLRGNGKWCAFRDGGYHIGTYALYDDHQWLPLLTCARPQDHDDIRSFEYIQEMVMKDTK